MRNPWEAHLKTARKYLAKALSVEVTLKRHSPYFGLEVLVGLLLMAAFWAMNRNLRRVCVDLKQRHAVKLLLQRLQTSTTQPLPQAGEPRRRRRRPLRKRRLRWLTDDVLDVGQLTTERALAGGITALTPRQFVRLDKEHQRRTQQTQECMHSLTTLFTGVVHRRRPRDEMREEIASAREHCAVSHVAHQLMGYVDGERVTDSLLSVLSDLIAESGADDGAPFDADLMTLVCDIGNLERDVDVFRTEKTSRLLLRHANPHKRRVGTR